MSIKNLEKIRELYFNAGGQYGETNKTNIIDYFMKSTIDLFKDLITDLQQFNKELRCREDLEKRIKKLEKWVDAYYMTEEELSREKIGGTD